jgi:hypothetical protein
LKGLEITLRVIGNSLFPAGKQDPDPLKGHGTYSSVMAFAALA